MNTETWGTGEPILINKKKSERIIESNRCIFSSRVRESRA